MEGIASAAAFAVFLSKLSAIQILFSAEILSRREFGGPKNSGGLAVLRLFFCCYCRRMEVSRE
jgi:hypothetical protein